MGVREGSITALIGPNGAGKTTFFNVITGFYKPDGAGSTYAGRGDHRRRPPYAIARPGHGPHLPDHEGARRDAGDRQHDARRARISPARSCATSIFRPARWRRREREVQEQAEELLEIFNLTKLADEYAGTLSGGQRKLLELARALMTRPRFLLLDEPMAGINPTLGRQLLDHMQTLRARTASRSSSSSTTWRW